MAAEVVGLVKPEARLVFGEVRVAAGAGGVFSDSSCCDTSLATAWADVELAPEAVPERDLGPRLPPEDFLAYSRTLAGG